MFLLLLTLHFLQLPETLSARLIPAAALPLVVKPIADVSDVESRAPPGSPTPAVPARLPALPGQGGASVLGAPGGGEWTTGWAHAGGGNGRLKGRLIFLYSVLNLLSL